MNKYHNFVPKIKHFCKDTNPHYSWDYVSRVPSVWFYWCFVRFFGLRCAEAHRSRSHFAHTWCGATRDKNRVPHEAPALRGKVWTLTVGASWIMRARILEWDDKLYILEMSIVHVPCVLDFGGAYLDKRLDHFIDFLYYLPLPIKMVAGSSVSFS
jgi:hypothetical protein